jgi:TetR/AcrR family transcriptional regulator, regulator of cefoperazone and chloramphenicol sensitivity
MKRAPRTRRSTSARGSKSVHDSAETRQRLIAAGRTLFANSGFARVTVRDICNEASTNVAAVNYHFGDKLGLYREVVRGAIDTMRQTGILFTDVAPDTSPENRLRNYVLTYLPRLARPSDDNQWIGRLMNHEMSDPTPIAQMIFDEAILPRLNYLRDIIAELLGLPAMDSVVSQCVASVQSQCLFYRADPFKAAVANWPPDDEASVAIVAEHVVTFSLAGIRAAKKSQSTRPKR